MNVRRRAVPTGRGDAGPGRIAATRRRVGFGDRFDGWAAIPTHKSTCGKSDRAICTDILHFRARVLVIQAARGGYGRATLIPDTVLPVSLVRPRGPVLPAVASRRTGPRVPWSERRSALRGHAAASTDGHVSHDADRLASTRARRAAAARDVRSAGTASPVPKYISSGVCPRNAECGSTRLCSST